MSRTVRPLDGITVMVVEDEYYLAEDIVGALRQYGAEIVGPFNRVASAVKIAETRVTDVAVIDINLGGQWAHDLISTLDKLQIPFIISSGYSPATLGSLVEGRPYLEKPYALSLLLEAIQSQVKMKQEIALLTRR